MEKVWGREETVTVEQVSRDSLNVDPTPSYPQPLHELSRPRWKLGTSWMNNYNVNAL